MFKSIFTKLSNADHMILDEFELICSIFYKVLSMLLKKPAVIHIINSSNYSFTTLYLKAKLWYWTWPWSIHNSSILPC